MPEGALLGLGKKRAVLLDALGTLVALEPPGPRLVLKLKEAHGIELSPQEAARAFAVEIAYYRAHHLEGRDDASLGGLRRRCAEVLRAALPAQAATIGWEELQAAMLAALSFTAYPDARATLGALRARGCKLVVVSNWDISVHAVLQQSGLGELLDGVLSSAEVGAAKPAPEIFRAALDAVGLPAEQALHVGDSPAQDVVGARAAGVAPVLLRRGSALDARVGGPDLPVGSLDAPVGDLALPVGSLDSPLSSPDTRADSLAGVPTISSLAELPALLT